MNVEFFEDPQKIAICPCPELFFELLRGKGFVGSSLKEVLHQSHFVIQGADREVVDITGLDIILYLRDRYHAQR